MKELLETFCETLGVQKAIIVAQMADGDFKILGYKTDQLDRAGLMYLLKKQVDVSLVSAYYEQANAKPEQSEKPK